MEKTYIYHPNLVCSKEMRITYEDGIIKDFVVIGGCPGNLKGIGALIKGMPLKEVAEKLQGIQCRNNTSCPDNLAKACLEILKQENL